jgi:hypothetical protein
MTSKFARCDDTHWVCEAHDEVLSNCFPSPYACKCA